MNVPEGSRPEQHRPEQHRPEQHRPEQPHRERRRATNLHLDAALVDEARRLGINLSRAAEAGLGRAVAEEAARRWRAENAEGIRQMNAWVEANGLPLARLRAFRPEPG